MQRIAKSTYINPLISSLINFIPLDRFAEYYLLSDMYTVKQKAIEAPIADKILKIIVVSEGLVDSKTIVKIKTIGITPK